MLNTIGATPRGVNMGTVRGNPRRRFFVTSIWPKNERCDYEAWHSVC